MPQRYTLSRWPKISTDFGRLGKAMSEHPVNLASRVTGVARPGSVLVAESARDAIGSADGFAWSFAGARRLKGVKGDVKLFRARRSAG